MANERDFSGAYSVVPILHKDSGEVHDVAVPADLTLGDLHGILLNSGYHGAETKPTAEGAVENSDAFRRNAKKAVTQSVMGVVDKGKGGEAGFTVQRSGTTSPVEWQPNEDPTSSGHIKQKIESEDLGALHTHDSAFSDALSRRYRGRPESASSNLGNIESGAFQCRPIRESGTDFFKTRLV